MTDRSYYVDAFIAAPLTRHSGISGNVFANYYDSGVPGAQHVIAGGATGSYYHNFGHLGTTASLGVYSFSQKDTAKQISGQAQLGMRYQF